MQVRTWSFVVLLVLGALVVLRIAAPVAVPVVLSILIALSLDPLVRLVQRIVRRRAVAAAIAVVGLVVGLGTVGYTLADDVADAAGHLPEATGRLRETLRPLFRNPDGPLDAIGRAADNIEATANEATGRRQAAVAARPWAGLGLRDWIVVGSMSVVGWAGQFVLLVFLVFFLLASDDQFKRKLVRLAGPALSARRAAVHTLDDIHRTVERCVLVIIATNVIVALASYLAFRAVGLGNAAVWALVGGVLNTVPYVGAAVTCLMLFLVALLQFDQLQMALLVSGVFLAITGLEGMLLKPWWMGRIGRLNNPAVFCGLLAWGWLWGAWGMLLAYPILMAMKTVADHVEPLAPVAELLGE